MLCDNQLNILIHLNSVNGLRSPRRTDHSSRGVLPTVARRCVWSRNFVCEEAIATLEGCKTQTHNGL